MPIAAVQDDHIDQQCALCGDVHPVMHTQLTIKEDPNVIAIPACPKCGAFEFLIRSGEAADEAGESNSHRKLVDQLHAWLMKDKLLVGGPTHNGPRAEA